MKRIGRGNNADTLTVGYRKNAGDNTQQMKSKSVSGANGSESSAGLFGIEAFAKSLILCGVEASCIETLTGLPQATVAKLFAEAAAEKEEEFKAGARALTERGQGKIPAQRPGKLQSYTGGLLWQKRQAEGLEASGCFATGGMNMQGRRPWEDRLKNLPDRFRLHCGM